MSIYHQHAYKSAWKRETENKTFRRQKKTEKLINKTVEIAIKAGSSGIVGNIMFIMLLWDDKIFGKKMLLNIQYYAVM